MDRSRTGTPSWPVFNRIPVTNATAPSPPRIRGPRQSGGRNPRPGAFPPIQNGTAETVPMPRRDFLDFAELSNPIAVGWKTRGDFFPTPEGLLAGRGGAKVGCILEAQPIFFPEGGNLAWKFGAREAGRSRTEENFQARVHQAEAHHILGAGEQNASRGHDPRGKPPHRRFRRRAVLPARTF